MAIAYAAVSDITQQLAIKLLYSICAYKKLVCSHLQFQLLAAEQRAGSVCILCDLMC